VSDQASNIIAKQAPGEGAPTHLPAGTARLAFEDGPLVDRCRRGDLRAFEALVAKYQDRIYNLTLRMTGQPADAEELAQETFLKALKKIGQFKGQSGFYTWLFRIATNLTISHQRHQAVGRIRFHPSQSYIGRDDGESSCSPANLVRDKSPLPETVMMNDELNQRIAEAIEQLDDDFRIVVVLRDVEEMDYSQIAEVLDVPMGTVKSRLHRARDILKEKLSDLVQP
jgi:RNA polymerase sigma-70 factor (ECF subfamily)